MGTSHSGKELGSKIERAAINIRDANKSAVTAAVMVYKGAELAAVRVATGGDMSLSGNRRGLKPAPKLGAGFDVWGREHATALLKARPPGPWSWLERGTVDHGIASKKLGGTRAARTEAAGSIGRGAHVSTGKRGALMFPGLDGVQYAPYVKVRGAPAKHTWSAALHPATRPAMAAFKRRHRLALAEPFGAMAIVSAVA